MSGLRSQPLIDLPPGVRLGITPSPSGLCARRPARIGPHQTPPTRFPWRVASAAMAGALEQDIARARFSDSSADGDMRLIGVKQQVPAAQ